MENSNGFGGSRSEFLPGEGYDDSDIKYQRHGGCFISTKKGLVYVLVWIATVVAASGLVYFYAPRWKDKKMTINDDNIDPSALLDMLKSGQEAPKVNEEIQKIQKNFVPLTYQLFIQPYLDEDPDRNFTFRGNVTINFYVDKHTRVVMLNAKGLNFDKPIFVSYFSTPKAAGLVSDSQVLEGSNNTDTALAGNETIVDNVTSDNSSTTSTVVPPAEPVVETGNNTITNETVSSTEAPANVSSTVPPEVTVLPDAPSPSNISISTTSSTTSTTTPSPAAPVEPPDNSSSSSVAPPFSTTTTVSTTTVTTTTSAPEVPVEVPANLNVVKVNRVEKEEDLLKIELDSNLQKGINYTIQISFNGEMSDEDGLVKASYMNGENKNLSWSAIANFKSNTAQKVFPCIEDPSYKVKYQINVARRTSKMTLSNMPIKESIPDQTESGWIWDVYEQTPPVSIHSVAFAVYNLQSKKMSSDPGAVINLWGRKDSLEKANYDLDITPKLMSFYTTFFGHHYPLSKLDLVAIPNMNADSNDNFGLISLSENVALVDRDSPNTEKELLLRNIAYDISRQWFGGIVTVKNRNESWILEGLSTYMQYLGINYIEPTWEKLYDFTFMTQDILAVDTKILSNDLVENEENNELTRKKACSIIRMLNNSLTDSLFIKGLRSYIDTWKDEPAEADSFWNILTQQAQNSLPKGITVKNIIDTWSNQNQNPVILIDRNYEKGSVTIQQVSLSGENKSWILPLSYITSVTKDSNALTMLWITNASTTIDNITSSNNDSWVLFNVQQTTPCRINYDRKNWKLLAKQLNETPDLIPPINRAQLIDDGFQLAKQGLLDYEVVIDLMAYLKDKEKHYLPWATALRNLGDIYLVLFKTSEFEYFQDYVLNLLTPIYKELGVMAKDTDTYLTQSLRALVLNWACKLNHKPCKDWMYSQYQTWANFTDPDTTHQLEYELRATMYCVGVQERGRTAWDFLWKRFKSPLVKENSKKALISGMGCSKEPWMLIRNFERALNASEISLKDSSYVWNSLSYGLGIHEGFEFLRENWKAVQASYGKHDAPMKAIVSGLFSKLSTKHELNDITRFFFSHEELKSYSTEMAQAAKQIQTRLVWKEKYLNVFINLLRRNI